jgi:hypothetical protein
MYYNSFHLIIKMLKMNAANTDINNILT